MTIKHLTSSLVEILKCSLIFELQNITLIIRTKLKKEQKNKNAYNRNKFITTTKKGKKL